MSTEESKQSESARGSQRAKGDFLTWWRFRGVYILALFLIVGLWLVSRLFGKPIEEWMGRNWNWLQYVSGAAVILALLKVWTVMQEQKDNERWMRQNAELAESNRRNAELEELRKMNAGLAKSNRRNAEQEKKIDAAINNSARQ